ncbi:hypothetical protein ECK5_21370 [Escherichia coli O10:K5(L):H4 str. ATCC 23506]|nr:hypothetical protein ECK5_21370 [Escherichia coli O10:K5(L):H4 str. ATCC 23506]
MPGLSLMTKAKSPDALRLSGLRDSCNLLNLYTGLGVYAASGMNKTHFVCNLNPGHHAQFILYCQP